MAMCWPVGQSCHSLFLALALWCSESESGGTSLAISTVFGFLVRLTGLRFDVYDLEVHDWEIEL